MTPEKARLILERYLSDTYTTWYDSIKLPIKDCVIEVEVEDTQITQLTFIGLIKIAYSL